jgi:sporulation protein YlmC with PRC-barrel domain
MLFFGSSFHNTKLFSIRSGGLIGEVTKPIINPNNLHIDAFFATAMNRQQEGVVVDMDVRDLSPKGLIINDHEDVTDASELVRLQPIIDIRFELIGKNVYVGRVKVGKVEDYVVDTKSLFIVKLYVQPSILKMSAGQMIFDRQSIVEVTDKKVVVSGPEQKATEFIRQKLPSSSPSMASPSTSSMSE